MSNRSSLLLYALAGIGALALVSLAAGLLLFPSAENNGYTLADDQRPRFPERQPHLETADELYLELLKRALTRYGYGENHFAVGGEGLLQKGLTRAMQRYLRARGLLLTQTVPFDAYLRENGLDYPLDAETMVGLRRLDNLDFCVREVLREGVPGDLIECGAWRGGSCIFMRGALQALGDSERTVWVADSFEGLPDFDREKSPLDAQLWQKGDMAVSLEQVQRNFARYGLLGDQVRFLKGFFADTLPGAPVEQLAILRLDADLYESTTQAFEYLYPKLAVGGYLIVDDYNLPPAQEAVHDYREKHGITDPIETIDMSGIYWKKTQPEAAP